MFIMEKKRSTNKQKEVLLKQDSSLSDNDCLYYTATLSNINESGSPITCTLFGSNKFGISDDQIGGPNGTNGAVVQIQESSHKQVRAEILISPLIVNGIRIVASNFEQLSQVIEITENLKGGATTTSLLHPLAFRKSQQWQSLQVDCTSVNFKIRAETQLSVLVLPGQNVTIIFRVKKHQEIANTITKKEELKRSCVYSLKRWITDACKSVIGKKAIHTTIDFKNKEQTILDYLRKEWFSFGDKIIVAVLENSNESGDPVTCTLFGANEFGSTNNQDDPAAKVTFIGTEHKYIRSESAYSPFAIDGLKYFVSDNKQWALQGLFVHKDHCTRTETDFRPLSYRTAAQQQTDQVDCLNLKFGVDKGFKFQIPVLPKTKVYIVMKVGGRFHS